MVNKMDLTCESAGREIYWLEKLLTKKWVIKSLMLALVSEQFKKKL